MFDAPIGFSLGEKATRNPLKEIYLGPLFSVDMVIKGHAQSFLSEIETRLSSHHPLKLLTEI
jgi:hypothetical protein